MSDPLQLCLEQELPPWLSPWVVMKVSPVFTAWELGQCWGNKLQKSLLGFQAIILPQILTGIAANILNVAMNALFLYALELGVV